MANNDVLGKILRSPIALAEGVQKTMFPEAFERAKRRREIGDLREQAMLGTLQGGSALDQIKIDQAPIDLKQKKADLRKSRLENRSTRQNMDLERAAKVMSLLPENSPMHRQALVNFQQIFGLEGMERLDAISKPKTPTTQSGFLTQGLIEERDKRGQSTFEFAQDPTVKEQLKLTTPSTNLSNVFQTAEDGILKTPLGTRGVGTVEDEIISMEKAQSALDYMSSDAYNSMYLTLPGDIIHGVTNLLENTGLDTVINKFFGGSKSLEDAKEFTADKSDFLATVGNQFLIFRKFITGVAGGIQEFREIEKVKPNAKDKPSEWEGKMRAAKRMQGEVRDVLMELRSEGIEIKPNTVEGQKLFEMRWRQKYPTSEAGRQALEERPFNAPDSQPKVFDVNTATIEEKIAEARRLGHTEEAIRAALEN